MQIQKMTLKNFKGIRELAIDFNGAVTEVFGTNAAGKTTLADAFNWLLFGKDSLNQANFEIKPVGEHHLDHEVEAVLDVGTFKRVFREKWAKKELCGHTSEFCLNGVPVQKKEYDAKVEHLAPEELFKMLTNPRYFSESMHWQKRREILMTICGDVTDADVIASDASLAGLSEILGDHSIEEFRKVATTARKKINTDLSQIPARINELNRMIVGDVVGFTGEKLTSANARLAEELRVKEREREALLSGGAVVEMTRQLLDLQNQGRKCVEEGVEEHRQTLNELKAKVAAEEAQINSWNAQINEGKKQADSIGKQILSRRDQWVKINSRVFENDGLCPTCKQPLPESAIEEARRHFNLNKSDQLAHVAREGKEYKAELTTLENNQSALMAGIRDARERMHGIQKEIHTVQTAIESARPPAEITTEIERLQAKMANLERRAEQPDTSAIDGEIQKLQEKIGKHNLLLASIQQNKTAMERIKELKAQEQDLSAQITKMDGEIYLTEVFLRKKVEMLEGRINGKFTMTKFKLFSDHINGGLTECCEITQNGVPYSSLNNAARINCGLDVINVLSKHYGFTAPIWIDNAESVVELLETKAQQVRLIVSEKDATLRIEHKEN